MTTFMEFVDNLETLTVSGVTRQYRHGPPESLGGEDLPAQWVQLPSADDAAIVFGEHLGWATMRAQIVIAVEAVGQKTNTENFDDTVRTMDAVRAGIQAMGACWPAKAKPSIAIRQTTYTVAGNDYWAVITDIESRG